jgi:HPt (histidine-containing phosphotransfer) domain-containing protein
MPELDGFQVIEAIRRREQSTGLHLPVVALTARSMKGDRERCLAAGMDEFLAKPIRREELFAVIARALAGQAPAEARAEESVPANGVLEPAALMAACDGDGGLLGRMIEVFQASAPAHLDSVGKAVERRDAAALRESAHKLRGLLSAFSTTAAEVALRLEQAGAAGQLDGTGEEFATLTDMVQALGVQLPPLSVADLKSRLARPSAPDPSR